MIEIVATLVTLLFLSSVAPGLFVLWLFASIANAYWYYKQLEDLFEPLTEAEDILYKIALLVGGLTWPVNLYRVIKDKETHLNQLRNILSR